MFRTLRGKLIASYVFLVVLSLALSGVAAGLLVTRTQRAANLGRTRVIALALAQRLRALPGFRARAPETMERLRREGARVRGRILILDRQGEIIVDSEEEYVGQRVPLRQQRFLQPLSWPNVRRHTFEDGKECFVVYVDLPVAQQRSAEAKYLAVALEIREVDPPWRELFRPLLLVGAIVLLVAVGIAFLLAHSITRPITQMTRAADKIAQGDYEQAIRAHGDDEIARLARSFSAMAREVARAQRTQRDFLADVSHDLRTPLTSIQGFSQAILEGAVTDEAGYRRAAEIIKGEADSMARLVQDLLELARLEARELDLAAEPVSVSQMLRSETAEARARLEGSEIEIVAAVADGLPGVAADAHRLEQALANLIDNAVKYARPGSRIAIEARHLPPDASRPEPLTASFGQRPTSGSWVCVTVTNQSEPIPVADLPRVFDRFYRGDKSRRRAEGSGLGLAIVRETILAHGGCVEASSDAEHGTRFRVWLPAAEG